MMPLKPRPDCLQQDPISTPQWEFGIRWSTLPGLLVGLGCSLLLTPGLGALSPRPPEACKPCSPASLPSALAPQERGAWDGGPGLGRPAALLHFRPASLSLYPWDKCLIPQGVKGKINHPGEISQPADLAGEDKEK